MADEAPQGATSEADVVTFSATPFTWREPATIPRRPFLSGFELRRGQLSGAIAPGAAGKTTYKVGRAICMATGIEMFGHRVWNGPYRVWLMQTADEQIGGAHACTPVPNTQLVC